MPSERAEWDHCQSYLRFYVALNESLSRRELKELLKTFARQVARAERAERRQQRQLARMLEDEARWYEALQVLVELTGGDGRSFLDFVRAVIPEPPEGFDKIGRFGNQKRSGPSPSIRIVPLPDPDERRWRREQF